MLFCCGALWAVTAATPLCSQIRIVPRAKLDSLAHPSTADGAQAMRFERTQIDAGHIGEDDTPPSYTFKWHNEGTAPLIITRVQTTCGCAAATYGRQPVRTGGEGTVTVDGTVYTLRHRDGLYVGRGSKDIVFASKDAANPAKFYLNSCPAHTAYPTVYIRPEDCVRQELGSLETANHRTICKYILPGQVQSCQLVMGMTKLEPGSVWNTMPCHTHDRRMEVYLYFDMPEDAFVMHFMGEGQETRHIIMRNEQAVISPSWSIHSGCGTQAYTFIWGMCGENQDFDDMDGIAMKDLK